MYPELRDVNNRERLHFRDRARGVKIGHLLASVALSLLAQCRSIPSIRYVTQSPETTCPNHDGLSPFHPVIRDGDQTKPFGSRIACQIPWAPPSHDATSYPKLMVFSSSFRLLNYGNQSLLRNQEVFFMSSAAPKQGIAGTPSCTKSPPSRGFHHLPVSMPTSKLSAPFPRHSIQHTQRLSHRVRHGQT